MSSRATRLRVTNTATGATSVNSNTSSSNSGNNGHQQAHHNKPASTSSTAPHAPPPHAPTTTHQHHHPHQTTTASSATAQPPLRSAPSSNASDIGASVTGGTSPSAAPLLPPPPAAAVPVAPAASSNNQTTENHATHHSTNNNNHTASSASPAASSSGASPGAATGTTSSNSSIVGTTTKLHEAQQQHDALQDKHQQPIHHPSPPPTNSNSQQQQSGTATAMTSSTSPKLPSIHRKKVSVIHDPNTGSVANVLLGSSASAASAGAAHHDESDRYSNASSIAPHTPGALRNGSFGLRRNMSTGSLPDDAEDDTVAISDDARTVSNAFEIQMAYGRIRKFLKPTPVTPAVGLCPGFRSNLLMVKHEQSLRTGSFKERGALNSLLLLTDEEKERGVCTASAGNHSSSLSYHAKRLGVPCYVFMPTIAPLTKRTMCVNNGADVKIVGNDLSETREFAMKWAEENNVLYVHGFNDPAIVNGAGSCGIELMEQVPDVEAVVLGVGGGGLLAGVAMACKQRNPRVQIIGVESEACPSFSEARKAGKPVAVDLQPSIADGAFVRTVGPHSFEVANPLVDEIVVVPESLICTALIRLMEVSKVVVEGSGALGVAGLLSGKLDHLRNKKVVCILTGGNVDITALGFILERALFLDKRLIRFRAEIPDKPGGMVNFLQIIAKQSASVKDIGQERTILSTGSVAVRITVETRGKQHAQEVLATIKEAGYKFEVERVDNEL